MTLNIYYWAGLIFRPNINNDIFFAELGSVQPAKCYKIGQLKGIFSDVCQIQAGAELGQAQPQL